MQRLALADEVWPLRGVFIADGGRPMVAPTGFVCFWLLPWERLTSKDGWGSVRCHFLLQIALKNVEIFLCFLLENFPFGWQTGVVLRLFGVKTCLFVCAFAYGAILLSW